MPLWSSIDHSAFHWYKSLSATGLYLWLILYNVLSQHGHVWQRQCILGSWRRSQSVYLLRINKKMLGIGQRGGGDKKYRKPLMDPESKTNYFTKVDDMTFPNLKYWQKEWKGAQEEWSPTVRANVHIHGFWYSNSDVGKYLEIGCHPSQKNIDNFRHLSFRIF